MAEHFGKPLIIEKPVIYEKFIDRPIVTEKIVPKFIDRPVPVYVEKKIFVEKPKETILIEKPVYVVDPPHKEVSKSKSVAVSTSSSAAKQGGTGGLWGSGIASEGALGSWGSGWGKGISEGPLGGFLGLKKVD